MLLLSNNRRNRRNRRYFQ